MRGGDFAILSDYKSGLNPIVDTPLSGRMIGNHLFVAFFLFVEVGAKPEKVG